MSIAPETIDALSSDAPLERALAAQALINSGLAWRLEGSVGRACMALIEGGWCAVGVDAHRDYWGNTVPGRARLQAGTKGTIGFVKKQRGGVWAKAIAAVPTGETV